MILTEGKTKIIIKRAKEIIGTISYLDLEKNLVGRMIFPIEFYAQSPIEIFVTEENNETYVGSFKFRITHDIITCGDYVIIKGARLVKSF